MDLIGAEIDDFVLIRLRCAGDKLFELPRLTFPHLICSQAAFFTICNSQQTIICELGDHLRMIISENYVMRSYSEHALWQLRIVMVLEAPSGKTYLESAPDESGKSRKSTRSS